ncbi:uncharacterized protein KY384_003913 [Bacidia gigantensis]|uniref:uncharacterized protein n=1 Tax=Bacidia gigantensis TaxID=2732470 RepID=UPI001D048B12|nr:uncharacterized protein KY384_003913 [Bacidia gigantensis]KAG8532272.1 hypothetical protein KY384_003913 [Bacidia gigantensis]
MNGDKLKDEDDEALKQFFPTSFGKATREADVARQLERSKRPINGEQEKPHRSASEDDEDDDDDEDDEDEDDEYPVSHELVLKTHDRPITSMTLDPSGSRLITGSTDCSLKFHDFASMTPNTLHSFKTIDPNETKQSTNNDTHPIHQVQFNPNSPSHVLVVTSTPQAKLFGRDGEELKEYVKGDMYLRDLHHTKGHISAITTGVWHPTNRNLFVTASTDSTLRIWDANMPLKQRDVIVHKSRAAGSAGRTRMTAAAWGTSPQGGKSLLVAAALDGSLAMWDGEGNYTRPAGEIREAHTPTTWTGGLDISADGRTVVTRGGDDTIKLWDTRKFKQPINSVKHLSTTDIHHTTNITYSPNSSSILTGSADGQLHILNPATLKPELVTPVTPGSSLITVSWHDRLNQILTGSANGELHVLYNPNISTKGAAMVMSKAPKRRHVDDDPNFTTDLSQGISGDNLTNGNDGSRGKPNTGLTVSGRSRDPRRPHIPLTTPFAKTQPDEERIKSNIPLSSMRDEDPREALLKYADKAEKDPLFTNAWKATQPKTIYGNASYWNSRANLVGRQKLLDALPANTIYLAKNGLASDDFGSDPSDPEGFANHAVLSVDSDDNHSFRHRRFRDGELPHPT